MKRLLFVVITVLIHLSAFCQNKTSLRQSRMEHVVMALYSAQMKSNIEAREKEMALETFFSYHVKKKDSTRIATLIHNREMLKQCYDTIYKKSIHKRVKSKMEIDSIFRDSINMVLIPIKGNKISGELFSFALNKSNNSIIKLDSLQYSNLMEKAIELANRFRKDPGYNSWDYEINTIKKLMSPKQQLLFFCRRNFPHVKREIEYAWEKLKSEGLTEQLDSATDMNNAANYYFEMHRIMDVYRYHAEAEKKNRAELARKMPKVVRMIDALEKKARVANDEKRKEMIGKEFAW